jgi:hypothetical protein
VVRSGRVGSGMRWVTPAFAWVDDAGVGTSCVIVGQPRLTDADHVTGSASVRVPAASRNRVGHQACTGGSEVS